MTDLDTKPEVEFYPPENSGSWLERNRKQVRRALIVGIITFIILGAISAWLVQPVPYIAIGPGDTQPVNDLYSVPKSEINPHHGRIYFTTVSESRGRIKRFQYYWVKWVDHDYELVSDQPSGGVVVAPCTTQETADENSMTESQRAALLIALRRVGKDATIKQTGTQIRKIVSGAPADGRFTLCDSVVSVNGKKTFDPEDVHDAVVSHKPGETLHFVVRSAASGKTENVDVKTIRGADGKAQVGIGVGTTSFDVNSHSGITFNKTDIGGPSAGLAFTLGLIDDLSKGDLTGGKNIAVTGMITDGDGNVGEIGGIREKTISVGRQGIKYFLVPPGNYKAAVRAAPKGMKIYKVATVEQAIKVLKSLGGKADLPPLTNTSEN